MKKSKQILKAIIITILFSILAYPQPSNIHITSSGDQNETAITVDPYNPNHMMATWNDWSSGSGYPQPGYAFSTDGGKTWPSQGVITGLNGGDPSCAIDLSGVEYYTYVTDNVPGGFNGLGAIKISYTTNDNSNGWSNPVKVSSSSLSQDKPYMAVNNTGQGIGKIFVAWTDFSQNEGKNPAINIAYSTNLLSWTQKTIESVGGVSPSQYMTSFPPISNSNNSTDFPPGNGPLVQSGIPAVGPDGTVYVVYLYLSNQGTRGASGAIRLSTSVDNFSSFRTIASIDGIWSYSVGNLSSSSSPTIAVDQNTGNIYVAWTDYNNGNLEIKCITSTDKGSSWSTPTVVGDGSIGVHFFPWLTVNSSGVVSLSYYAGNSNSVDVYVAQSYDNGNSFTGNGTKITQASMSTTVGIHGFEYIGATSLSNGETLTCWTNPTGTTANVYTTPYYFTGGTISQSLTIPTGQATVFAPGAVTKFAAGASLTVNGALTANGTSTNGITFTSSSGYWNGITFNGANGSSIQNTTIAYAYSPIVINSTSSITISGCTLNHSSFYNNNSSSAAAIQVNNSSPTISSTTIEGQSDSWNGVRFTLRSGGSLNSSTIENLGDGNGVIIQGGSNPTIFDNVVQYNYYHGIIIYYNGTGAPTIEYNNITHNGTGGSYVNLYFLQSTGTVLGNSINNNYYGIWCRYSSSPNSGGLGQEGGNIITANNYGLEATDNSYPEFGGGLPPRDEYYGVCNQIYNNTSYDAYVGNSSTLTAQVDWWGQYPPNTSKMHTDGTSSIDYAYAETSSNDCPLNGASPAYQTNINTTNSTSGDSLTSLMQEAMEDKFKGDYADAKSLCQGLIKDNASQAYGRQALVTLFNIYQSTGDSTIVNDLINYSSLKTVLSITAKELLASAFASEGKLAESEKTANYLVTTYPNSDAEKYALLTLSSLGGYSSTYDNVSSSAINKLFQKYNSSIDSGIVTAIGGQNKSISPSTVKVLAKQVAKKVTEDKLSFKLRNFPNPFNPTTTIAYVLPTTSEVNITIYNILGEEVKTFHFSSQSAGRQNIVWNGTNGNNEKVSSGVYLYHFRASSLNGKNEVYEKTAKLILMK